MFGLKLFAIILGSLLISFGVNCFLVPFRILDGGMIGFALIINYIFGSNVGLVMFLSSIPIFFLAWLNDRPLFYNSILGLLVSSFFIDYLVPFHYYFLYYIELSPLYSAIIGGLVIGVGIGIMLRFEASTGGTDLLAHYLTRWLPLNVGILIFIMDGLVIGSGALLISKESFLLSILTITAGGMATTVCMHNASVPHTK